MATGFDLVPCFPSTRRAKHSEHAGRIPHISERLRLLQQVHNQPSAVWDKSPTGGNDQRPPAGQLTALILHNDSPHFPRTAAVRAAARPGRHPTFNVTSERWKRVRGGGAPSNCLRALRQKNVLPLLLPSSLFRYMAGGGDGVLLMMRGYSCWRLSGFVVAAVYCLVAPQQPLLSS